MVCFIFTLTLPPRTLLTFYSPGLECKICTRPFTVFRWAADRTSRFRKTNVCLTCARLKNCCQCCMLDLTFGLPIVVRDAALKLVTQGPTSSINKEYFAQNNEGKFKDGDIPEEYEKTDAAARDLLKRLANSQPYYRKPRGGQAEGGREDQQRQITAGGEGGGQGGQQRLGPGPIRTERGRGAARGRGGASARGRGVGGGGQPGPHDAIPPNDPTITSLFLTGIEDDLPEHAIRDFFSPFGNIRSLVCVHRSRSAFVNYATRQGAEAAAESCQGRAVSKFHPSSIPYKFSVTNISSSPRVSSPCPMGQASSTRQHRSQPGRRHCQASSSSKGNGLQHQHPRRTSSRAARAAR